MLDLRSPRETRLGHGLYDLVVRSAELRPDAPAVEAGGRRLSYAQLDEAAGRVAAAVMERGAGWDSTVVLVLERGLDLLAAVAGVARAGAAFAILDPDDPPERLRTAMEILDARCVMTRRELSPALPAGLPTIMVDELPRATDGRPAPERALAFAYMTSGSTGVPKPALIERAAACSYVAAAVEAFGLDSGDRVLQMSPPGFDVLVEEVFPTWAAGGTVVVPDGGEPPLPGDLSGVLEDARITVVELTTAYWQAWVDAMDAGAAPPPACLRRLLVGGERMSMEHFERWRVRGIPTSHVYGLTETAVTSTAFHTTGTDAVVGRQLPVGKPFANSTVRVLDARLDPVPLGIAGDVYIGGAGVGRGYGGRFALTAERYLPDPYGEPGARMYRTGDRGRLSSDGNLELLGRSDHQVKLRGQRVELGEVEAALEQHPAVGSAVVTCQRTGADRTLVAHVAGAVGAGDIDDAALRGIRDAAAERLPRHMLPAHFNVVTEWPLTATGKIDRRALERVPVHEEPALPEELPSGPVEERIGAIYGEALGRRTVSATTDFFALGGHSLLAMSVVWQVREAFGVDVPLRTFLAGSSIREVAVAVEDALVAAIAELPDEAVEEMLRDNQLTRQEPLT